MIATVVASTGADVDEARAAVDDGTGARRLLDSVDEARDEGIVATPAWRFAGGFVVPGVHSRDQFRRWALRLMERAQQASGAPTDDR